MSRAPVALAVTVHDPGGHLLPGIERAGIAMREQFAAIAVNATEETAARTLDRLRSSWGARVATHASGWDRVGSARRDAVRLALAAGANRVLYCDLDHAIRWIEAAPREVAELVASRYEDIVVVGRSAKALARSPARLRETEALVNRVYELATGRAWDLMFAVRLLSRLAAEAVVGGCSENTIANDVEWPLFAETQGFSVGYAAAEGFAYRTTSDFDKENDERDRDPLLWIDRIEIAALHAATIRRFLQAKDANTQPVAAEGRSTRP